MKPVATPISTLTLFSILLALAAVLLLLVGGCARADLATVYTEDGVRAAEQVWDASYRERLAYCQAQYKPKTPEAEECFGGWYDGDAHVETAVGSIVGILRAYWLARASGGSPSWAEVATQVAAIVNELPPEARAVFQRVKGIK